MRSNTRKLTEGFILLDALLGFIILAMVLASFSMLFSTGIRSVSARQSHFLEYLESREEFILSAEYEF